MNIKKTVFLLLKVAFSAGVIYWLLKNTDIQTIWGYIKGADYFILTAAFVMFYIGYYLSGVRLQVILNAIGIQATKFYLVRSFTIGMLFNNLLPSTVGGDAYRMYDVWRLCNDKSKSFSSVFLDRFLGMFALVTLGFFALFFVPQVNQEIPGMYFYIGGLWLVMMVVLFSVFNNGSRLVDWALNLSLPFIAFIQKFIKKIVDSVYLLRGRVDVQVKTLIYSFLLQVNAIIHFILVAIALHIDIPWHTMFFIVPISTLILLLPISINGVGLREVVFVFLFGIFGASAESAIAFAWVGLAMVLLQGIVGGIVFLTRRSETRNYVEPQ